MACVVTEGQLDAAADIGTGIPTVSSQSGAFYDHSTGGRLQSDYLAGLSQKEWPAWTAKEGRLHVEDVAKFIGIRTQPTLKQKWAWWGCLRTEL